MNSKLYENLNWTQTYSLGAPLIMPKPETPADVEPEINSFKEANDLINKIKKQL